MQNNKDNTDSCISLVGTDFENKGFNKSQFHSKSEKIKTKSRIQFKEELS